VKTSLSNAEEHLPHNRNSAVRAVIEKARTADEGQDRDFTTAFFKMVRDYIKAND
jgi:hypothetical protein